MCADQRVREAQSMRQMELGTQGLVTSAIGLGCMPLSGLYGSVGEEQALSTLEQAVEAGITLLDTADVYGLGRNETLVGRLARRRRDDVVVATKAGFVRNADGSPVGPHGIDGRPEHLYLACDASLRRLDVETIDLYQLHRVDPRVPIEESVGALAELVRLGKVRHIGLSEAQPHDIRRAHREHPIATVQSEYSLVERSVEADVIPVCRELGIGILAYAPLCRGLLAGTLPSTADVTDTRNSDRFPRLARENREANAGLAATVGAIAEQLGCTAGQVALAWLLLRPGVVPIPGTKRGTYARDNAAADRVVLLPDQVARLDDLVHGVSGARYGGDAPATAWVSPEPGRSSTSRPRLVVTGHTARGDSVVTRDERLRHLPVPDRLGYSTQPIWAIERIPSLPLIEAGIPALTDQLGTGPGGVRVVQVVVMPSRSADERAVFDKAPPETLELVEGAAPGIHFTHSVDIVTVLEGEIVLVLEGEEVTILAGDTVVQNGTTHAWRNDTARPSRFVVVRLGAEHRGAPPR